MLTQLCCNIYKNKLMPHHLNTPVLLEIIVVNYHLIITLIIFSILHVWLLKLRFTDGLWRNTFRNSEEDNVTENIVRIQFSAIKLNVFMPYLVAPVTFAYKKNEHNITMLMQTLWYHSLLATTVDRLYKIMIDRCVSDKRVFSKKNMRKHTCKSSISHLFVSTYFAFASPLSLLRGFAKLQKFQKSEKNSEVGGWIKPQLGFLIIF